MERYCLLLLAACALTACRSAKTSPQPVTPGAHEKDAQMTVLENKPLKVEIINPNEQSAFRGPRFEWSGMVWQITLDGKHTFCRTSATPDAINDGVGLAEEASEPLGFDEVGQGGEFVKLGIGVLQKHNNEPYGFWKPYPIVSAPKFDVRRTARSVTHTQIVRGPRDWAYRYSKTVSLVGDEPTLTLTHELENIGKKPIKTSQYNHNFMVLDRRPVGQGYTVCLRFHPAADGDFDLRGIVEFTDSCVTYGSVFDGKPVFVAIKGFTAAAEQNSIAVQDQQSGTGVEITGDFPLAKLHFFTTPEMICPEPFVALNIEPGQKQQWTRIYTFRSSR